MRLCFQFAKCAGLLLAVSVASAQLPEVQLSLVKDLNGPQPAQLGSAPQYFKRVGPHVYFRARTPTTGVELYRTDGTDGGLELAADIAPGVESSFPVIVGAAGQRAIVLADDGSGPQFWSVSAGEATQRLTSENWSTAPTATTVWEVAQIGGRLLWATGDSNILWSSDGTAAGTRGVTAPAQFPGPSIRTCNLTNTVVMAGMTDNGMVLGSTDGLTGVFLAEIAGATDLSGALSPSTAAHNSDCLFLWRRYAGGWTLWRSNGTAAGTYEFANSPDGWPAGIQVLNQQIFVFDQVGTQLRVRRSIAEWPGLALVSDNHSPIDVDRVFPTVVDEYMVYIAVPPGSSSGMLYRSDGTTAGTQPLLDGNVAVAGPLFAMPGAVMARVNNVWSAVDLASGTVTPVAPFIPTDSARLGAARIGSGTDGYGSEVWISDGSAVGTRRLHNVYPDNPDGIFAGHLRGNVATVGAQSYFLGRPLPLGAAYLWRSDGTAAGTQVMPRSLYEFDNLGQLQAFGDELLFLNSQIFSMQRYRTKADFSAASLLRAGVTGSPMQLTGDGQAAVSGCGMSGILCVMHQGDTVMTVISALPAQTSSKPIGAIGDIAVFATTNNEFWRSDASAPGTYRIAAGRRFSSVGGESSAAFDGKLYFLSCAADDSDCQLTFTDGTMAGTGFLLPLSMNTAAAATRLGSRMLFALASSFNHALQLWISDGTAAGTQMLWSGVSFNAPNPPDLVALDGYAHLSWQPCGTCTESHLVTDGSVAGTRLLQLPAPYTPVKGLLTMLDEQSLVFTCRSPAAGTELCASNPAGTVISSLPEIFPGNGSSLPSLIGRTGAGLLIAADDGQHGVEPWLIRILTDDIFANGFEAASP